MGTPRYMSPEQIRGDEVDARSDIFSTGAVLHELLTGRTPFTGKGLEEVMAKLLYDEADLAPESEMVPGPLLAVVAKAIAKSPDDRYQSAEAMAAAIRSALGVAPARPIRTQLIPAAALSEIPPPPRDPTLQGSGAAGGDRAAAWRSTSARSPGGCSAARSRAPRRPRRSARNWPRASMRRWNASAS